MLNLILCEFQKFKRRPLFLLATLAAFVFPALTALFYWNTPGGQDYDNLFSGVVDPGDYLLLLPVLVVLSTTLFFTEQDSDTLKNLMTIPVSKGKLVLAKISVMAVISVVYSLAGFLASAVCAKLLGMAFINMGQKFVISLLLGFMMLAAALPCAVFVVWFNKNNLICDYAVLHHCKLCVSSYRFGDEGLGGVQYRHDTAYPFNPKMDFSVLQSGNRRVGGIL